MSGFDNAGDGDGATGLRTGGMVLMLIHTRYGWDDGTPHEGQAEGDDPTHQKRVRQRNEPAFRIRQVGIHRCRELIFFVAKLNRVECR